MKRLFLVIIVTSFFLSCKQNTFTVIIPKEKMKEIIIDFHLTDAIMKTDISYRNQYFVNKSLYDSIFKKHNVSEKQFVWNMMQYNSTNEMAEIYQDAIADLSSRKGEIEKNILQKHRPH